MKKLFFNYFVKKCVEYKQSLLGVGFKEALLSLAISHTTLIRRYAHGVTSEEIFLTNRYFLEELFLILCIEAKKNGQDLFGYYDFHHESCFRQGSMFLEHIEDSVLDKELETIFPVVKTKSEVPYPLYEKVTHLSSEELIKKSHRLDNLCKVTIDELELPTSCKETEIIDDTWERLMKDGKPVYRKFVSLLSSSSKHTPQGESLALGYLKQHYATELELYIH